MLNLPILQSPNLSVYLISFPFQLLLFLDDLFHGLDKYFLTKQLFSSRVKQSGRLVWGFTLMKLESP